jgi:PAS domain S-box-containing protein
MPDLIDKPANVGPAPRLTDNTLPADSGHDIFFAAVETTRMPMIVTDPHQPDNPIVFCNRAFERMTGYDRNEIMGVNCRFLQGPETDRDTVAEVRDAIARQEEIAVEILNYRKNGSTFWNALFISPVRDSAGNVIYFFASQLDISRRREAEEALHQAQKMEAVGQLTGGIAHDFNNLLQVILGYVDILSSRVAEEDRAARRAVDAIGTAAARGATLTQQLLAFARKQELRDRLLNFNSLIGDFAAIIERTLGEGIQLRRELADDLWNCRVDPVQAEMAVLNILSNARDALDGQGNVTIATGNRVLVDGEADADRVAPGEYVEIVISDNGPGIAESALDKLFDPFFSTKQVGKGTGLGLSMVYGFMRQSGGQALAENNPDGGATFRLLFPRAKGLVERAPGNVAAGAGGSELILMVEDQAEVAELGQAMLEDLGYRVKHVFSPRDALRELESDGSYGLLFTDIVMPGDMNGVELATAVRRRFPHVKVLLTTGYSDRGLDEASRAFDLIRKPYRRAELSAKVRALIDGPNGLT